MCLVHCSCVGKPAAILVALRCTVEQTCSSSETLIPTVQIGLMGALTLLLQRSRTDSSAGQSQPSITASNTRLGGGGVLS